MRKNCFSISAWLTTVVLIVTANSLKAQVDPCAGVDLSNEERIQCLRDQAIAEEEKGNLSNAVPYLVQANDLARLVNNQREQLFILSDLVFLLTQIGNQKEALRYGYFFIEVGSALNDSLHLVMANVNVGRLQYQNSNYVSAITHYQEALKFVTPELQYEQGVALLNLGVVFRDIGSFEKAMKTTQEAISIFEEIGMEKENAAALNSLGVLHEKLGNYELSNKYHRSALSVRTAIDHQYGKAGSLHNLGKNFQEIGELDSAKKYLNQALQIKLELGKPKFLTSTYNVMGKLYLTLNYLDSSFYFHQKALGIRITENDKVGMVHSANSLANLYLIEGDYTQADSLLYWALELGKKSNNFSLLAETYDLLALRYENGNRDSLNRYLRLLIDAKDSLYQLDKNRALIELDNRFEIKQKEKEINWLQENDRLQSKQFNTLLVASILIGILLILVLLILMKQIAQTRKIRNLGKELSHRTKNHLQLLSAIFDLQGKHHESPHAKTFAQSAQTRIDAVNLINQQLKFNDKDEWIDLSVYLEELISNLKHAFGDSIQAELRLQSVRVNSSLALNYGLITSEIITNSIKHVQQEDLKIQVELTYEDGHIKLVIKDNGPGINWEGIEKSLGLELVEIQTKQLKANLSHANEDGSVFTLLVPQ